MIRSATNLLGNSESGRIYPTWLVLIPSYAGSDLPLQAAVGLLIAAAVLVSACFNWGSSVSIESCLEDLGTVLGIRKIFFLVNCFYRLEGTYDQ